MNLHLRRARIPAQARATLCLAVIFSVLISRAGANCNSPVRVFTSEVTVRVRIVEPQAGRPAKDESGIAVWLVPVSEVGKSPASTQQPRYRIVQRNKTFEPHLLVVPTGSTVEFPNLDPWFHSAFSASTTNPFHLGANQPGGRRAVRFDRPGASYIFCGIHPEMAAVVLAVDSPYFTVTDQAGHASIANLPPGKYLLRVWYEGLNPRTLAALQNIVVVGDGRANLPPISVAVPRESSMIGATRTAGAPLDNHLHPAD